MTRPVMTLQTGIIFSLLPFLFCGDVFAYTFSDSYTWGYGSSSGQPAGTCTFTYTENAPLMQSRVLVVDNHLPDGSVLYSWSYADFIPDYGISCISSGITSDRSNIVSDSVGGGGNEPSLFYSDGWFSERAEEITPGVYKTSIDGIGLRLWVKVNANNPSNTLVYAGGWNTPNPGFEGIMTHNAINRFLGATGMGARLRLVSQGTYKLDAQANVSVRGELVKTGAITTSGPLSVNTGYPGKLRFVANGYTRFTVSQMLAGNGVIIQLPACRLRGGTDYQIDLGRWVNVSYDAAQSGAGFPLRGNTTPVGLNLECTGKLDNVEFSFQDTGSSPLPGRNISVYDNIGGQRIEGLEIEMTHNGSRLNVHKMGEDVTQYKTNTGSHGNIKIDASDTGFNSQSQAQFGARFVQTAPVVRNGTPYTGPVTGRVNMFVTYY